MSTQQKLIPLINELSKRTLFTPSILTVEPLTTPEQGVPHNLRLIYTQQNYRESATYKGTTYLNFNPASEPALTEFPAFTSVESDILTDTYSPSKELRALFRKNAEKITLEIWNKNGMVRSIRVSDFHEAPYADPIFCLTTIVWSEDEKRVLYVAEKKEEKIEKYFDVIDNEEQILKTFGKYEYKDELGEGYRGKKTPLIFIYDIEEEQLSQVLNIPKETIPTYISFSNKEGTAIVFNGIDFNGMKLGIRFCTNRRSKIYHARKLVLQRVDKKPKPEQKAQFEEERKKREAEAEKELAVALNQDAISTCPVLSKDKRRLVYLFSPWKTMHSMGLGMKMLTFGEDGAAPKEEVLFDVVQENRKKEEFPGVTGFVDILSRTSWLSERHVVFNSYAKCSVGVFLIDVQTKEVRRLDEPKFESEEWNLKRVFDGCVAVTVSHMNEANKIAILQGFNLKAEKLEEVVKNAKWHSFELKIEGFEGKVVTELEKKYEVEERVIEIEGIQSLYFGAKGQDNSTRPLVMFLHGGPHAVYTGNSTVMRQYLINQGYNLLMPAFTGSLGYGQKFIEDLIGKIGEIDVDEILKSLDYCVGEKLCDGKKVVIFGGSYGGFLCGVLMAKYSELFKGAIILNPAINCHHLWETSDIPDWSTCEVLNKDTVFDVTNEDIKKLYDMSPISMYKGRDVNGSILLMIGEKDKRVPPGGGLHYYKLLKAKGADVKLLTYPEGEHSLAGNPEMEFDVLIQVVNFLNEKFF